MKTFDLTTRPGRFWACLDFLWNDHAYLRLGFQNAFWISREMVRSNQPWPYQLKRWKREGIKTVVNLRGGFDASFFALEKDACERYGLNLVNFTVTSRDVPTRSRPISPTLTGLPSSSTISTSLVGTSLCQRWSSGVFRSVSAIEWLSVAPRPLISWGVMRALASSI